MKEGRTTISANKRDITSNIVWSVASKAVSMIAALLVGIYVARYLGPEQYGLMNYVVSFVGMFLMLATFGFENIEIREEAAHPERRDAIIGTTFALRLALSAATVALVMTVAWINEGDSETLWLIGLYALSVMMTPFEVVRNHFTAILKNQYVSKLSIAITCWSCGVKTLLLLTGASLQWFIAALVLDTVFGAAGYLVAYRVKIGSVGKWSFDRNMARYMVKQSFPLMLSGAAAYAFLRVDQVMIGNMLGKEQVGYFAVASKFVEILAFIPTIVVSTVCPLLVKIKQESEQRYQEKAQQFLDTVVWTSALCAIGMSLAAPWLVKYTFGASYLPAIPILAILSYKAIAVGLNVASGQVLIIDKRQKWFVVRSVSGLLVCVLLNLYVIPRWGTIGAAYIAIATQLVAGWLVHLSIPQYRYVFNMQCKALLLGWHTLPQLGQFVRRSG
jgi:O-antigen/teichoic acid export membrane protein